MNFYKNDLRSKNEHFSKLRVEHEIWKDKLLEMNKPFFMIPSDFSHLFLKDISGGALKLYLFLGFHSKYRSGESWYTNEQISLFFEKDIRTITKWFSELEELGLIFRAQKGVMMKANTFLRPYGLFVDEENSCFAASVEQIRSFIVNEKNHKLEIAQAIILNNGIQETNLVLMCKEQNENVYSLVCFFELEFSNIKNIRALFKKLNIHIDNFEISAPLSVSKYSNQVVYKSIINYLDEKNMWL